MEDLKRACAGSADGDGPAGGAGVAARAGGAEMAWVAAEAGRSAGAGVAAREIITALFNPTAVSTRSHISTSDVSASACMTWAVTASWLDMFLRGYVADDGARALLRQVVSVLGWDRVRELNEQQTLPFLRSTLESLIQSGDARPVPIEATVEIFFSTFYNAVLYITDAADPSTAAQDAKTVIFCALEGLKTPDPRLITRYVGRPR